MRRTDFGDSQNTVPFEYQFWLDPIEPRTGGTLGGTIVTLRGRNFLPGG